MIPGELNKTEIRILKAKLERLRKVEYDRILRAERNPHWFKPSIMKLKLNRYNRVIRAIDYIESLFR